MTLEEIKRLEDLSMLKFSDEELNKFLKDFGEIESFINAINKVELPKQYKATKVCEFEDLREDEIKPSFDRELTLKNAPRKDSISFIVPKVVE